MALAVSSLYMSQERRLHNDEVVEVVGACGCVSTSDDTWFELTCECGDERCSAVVLVTALTYEDARLAGNPILSAGHKPDGLTEHLWGATPSILLLELLAS
jgi:hypothetical protein